MPRSPIRSAGRIICAASSPRRSNCSSAPRAAEPADAEINEHLGDAYYTAGRRYEARYAWRAALLSAEDEAAERLRAKIDRGLTPALASP